MNSRHLVLLLRSARAIALLVMAALFVTGGCNPRGRVVLVLDSSSEDSEGRESNRGETSEAGDLLASKTLPPGRLRRLLHLTGVATDRWARVHARTGRDDQSGRRRAVIARTGPPASDLVRHVRLLI